MDYKDLLIVEDNNKVSQLLGESFEQTEFNLHYAYTIGRATQIVRRKHIDCVILDLVLPDGLGFEFCRRLKQSPQTRDIKVLILTRKVDLSNRVKSFKFGADDYLPKPFYPEELLMRVKKVLNIMDTIPSNNLINKGHVRFNTYNGALSVCGKRIPITSSEKLIMQCLLVNEHANKDHIIRYLSAKKDSDVTVASLSVAVNRLKKKIFAKTGLELIKCNYGVGYYLEIPVEQ